MLMFAEKTLEILKRYVAEPLLLIIALCNFRRFAVL